MNNEQKKRKKLFLTIYKELCKEYGMYVGLYAGEGSCGDLGVEIEEALSENELDDHFKELKINS